MSMGVGGGIYDRRPARLRRLRRHIDALELRFAVEAAEFAWLPEFSEDVHADSPVSVLRDECHLTAGNAARAICIGERVYDRLPASVHEGGWRLEGSVKDGFVAIPPRPWWLADLPAA